MSQAGTIWQRARRTEQKAERQAAILSAAAHRLDSEGIEATGLNAIARDAGMSKPNVYNYFESREAILLNLLLDEHRSWTQAFGRRLKRLKGSNDIPSVAKAFAESIAGRKRYCVLIGALATVLEHNVGPETITEFKRQLHQENLPLAALFKEALTSLTEEQAYSVLAMLLMAATGMWPHCHPAPAVRKVLENPEFAFMRFDFKKLVRQHTELLLQGQLGR